jgi:hypothetical protein
MRRKAVSAPATPRERWLARRRGPALAAVTAVTWLALAGMAPAAHAGWGHPFALAQPGSLDDIAPQLAFSASGAATAAFGIEDVDTPGVSQAYLTTRSAQGAVSGARPIPGAEQILDLAYDGSALELLTGASPPGLTCCSSAQVIQVSPGGRAGRARTLIGGLAGATSGTLVTLADGQMLAAIATERGVWASQSTRGGQFGAPDLLTRPGDMPETMSAAWLGGENSVLAWTAGSRFPQASAPRSIYVSGGTRLSGPHRALKVITVPPGHRIDELAIVPRGGGATAAWIESWSDSSGAYHSQVEAADLAAHPRVRALSPAGRLASGVDFAADAAGDQAAIWESCTLEEVCTAQAALRGAGAGFGAPRTLGAIDPSESPSMAVDGQGQVLAGWVSGGRPVAAVAPTADAVFGAPATFNAPATLSSATDASDLTLAYGPRGRALAAWTQGASDPIVVGAAYRGP